MRKERGKVPVQGIGRALVKSNQLNRASRRRDGRIATSNYHISNDNIDVEQQDKLNSIMERNAMDEFLTNAMLEEVDFSAQKSNVMMLTGAAVVTAKTQKIQEQLEYEHIRIPRRPAWNHGMAPDELQRLEREAFLDWRRDLAMYEQNSVDRHATPFEKNIEVWKQLWRVAERSHVIVQIVDARNPLLFYCKDVFTFTQEINPRKKCLLVINKADFLTREARVLWGKYFERNNIPYVFWSAKLESVEAKEEIQAIEDARAQALAQELHSLTGLSDPLPPSQRQKQQEKNTDPFLSTMAQTLLEEEDEDAEEEDSENQEQQADNNVNTPLQTDSIDATMQQAESSPVAPTVTTSAATAAVSAQEEDPSSPYSIRTRDNLIAFLESQADMEYVRETHATLNRLRAARKLPLLPDESLIHIGLLGFPNVGKSSTINALLGKKKVSVAATPGHTKHFQTLRLNENAMLCDCPGLVFPTFVHSKHTLVVNGVIPIDTLRDTHGPMEVLVQKISRSQIAQEYGLELPQWKLLDATTLLQAYCKLRSYYKHGGSADEGRAARMFLKDFVNGKLLYCQAPPNLTPAERRAFYNSFGGEVVVDNVPGLAPSVDPEEAGQLPTELDFIQETERLTNTAQAMMAKHGSLDANVQQELDDVVNVTVSRKTVAVQPDTSDLALGYDHPSYREQLENLNETAMTKKQARRMQKQLQRGTISIGNNGAHQQQSAASRRANK